MTKSYIFQEALVKSFEVFKERTAIEYGKQVITYEELDKWSNYIGNSLLEQGIERGKFIGVFIENRFEFITTIIGIIKAGCVFVPLDTTYPLSRLEAMIIHVDMGLVISDLQLTKRLMESPVVRDRVMQRQLTILLSDKLFGQPIAENSRQFQVLSVDYTADDSIYVYFTSGTTGTPKAIVGKNKSLTHFIQWEIETFTIDGSFRISQFTTVGFDACLRDIFVPLFAGGVLCIPPDKNIILDPDTLIRWIDENRISLMHGVPSFFRVLICDTLTHEHFKNLKYVLLSGERIHPPDLVKWYNLFNDRVQLVNFYGPTETTMIKTFYLIQPGDVNRENIPVGMPMKGARIIVLDDNMQICKKLEVGEIFIRTPFRTWGYYNDQELNQKKFIPNPFSDDPADLIFRTGDRGRIMADGNLEFLGRMDRQVKLRGVRIELDGIESILIRHPQVKQVVVVKKEVRTNENLFAYLTLNEGNSEEHNQLTIELKEYMGQQLPEYMIPSHFMVLEKIPLKPNGKVDYDRLPDVLADEKQDVIAPRNQQERILQGIWSELLGFEDIGVTSNFFELGGNSLNVMSLISKIHRQFDVRLPLGDIFKNPTIEKQAQLLKVADVEEHAFIEWAEEKEYYRLSAAQRRMFVIQQMEKTSIVYNMMRNVRQITGTVDKNRLENVFRQLIRRHESFRTSFIMIEGEPVQRILPEVDFQVEYYRIEDKGEKIPRLIDGFIQPFDLEQAPLLRVGLIEVENTVNLLLIDMHHIIADGVSEGILFNEYMAYYQEEQAGLPVMKLRYRDFAEWQGKLLASGEKKSQEMYWLNEFAGEIPVLELPTDYPRPVIQSVEGRTVQFSIGSHETRLLKAFALMEDATLFMVLLTVYYTWLHKLSEQEDMVIGTPIAGRRHEDLEPIVGMFVNMLALRNYPSSELTFFQFLAKIKEQSLQAFENQEYQFEELVEQVFASRDISRNPLFDVVFSYDMNQLDDQAGVDEAQENEIQDDGSSGPKISRFDMTLGALEGKNRFHFYLEYCTRLFKVETIKKYIGYFKTIITQVTRNPRMKLADIDMVSPEEKQMLLEIFNDTEAQFPGDRVIHSFFKDQVLQVPDQLAVIDVDGVSGLTYAKLDQESNRLAMGLIKSGVVPGTIVPLLIDRCAGMITAILGVLKAGGAYLPVDPGYPLERIRFILSDSDARILVSNRRVSREEGFGQLKGSHCETMILEDVINETRMDEGFSLPDPGASSLAYIIYTSGSTGRPKGVMIEHRQVVRLFFNDKFLFDFNRHDVWSLFHSYSFDFSVWEMYGALVFGGRVLVVSYMQSRDPRLFLEAVVRHQVTVLNQTPSAFYNFIEVEQHEQKVESTLSLRYVILGGEALQPTRLRRWYQKYPQIRLINMFGITETTVHVTYKEIGLEEIDSGSSKIGKPLPTLTTYILDRNQRLKPVGMVGELGVGGEGVARGYLNRPELTSEKFIDNPFKPGNRLYLSGDLGRLISYDDMEYLGRIDHQVQLRGFRIELGEIASQLELHPLVEATVVMDRKNERDELYLCAYIIPVRDGAGSESQVDVDELRRFLSRVLPDYMIPSYFLMIEKIPLTANGKVDRRLLASMDIQTMGKKESYIPPETDLENRVVNIWKEVLHADRIGRRDNYFEVGGNSLNLLVVVKRLEDVLGIQIPITAIFEHPTPETLARYLGSALESKEKDQVMGSSEPEQLHPTTKVMVEKRRSLQDQKDKRRRKDVQN